MQKFLQIAASVLIKHYAFLFQQALLLVLRQHHSSGGTRALRIQHAMPWRTFRRSVHTKTDSPWRVTVTEKFRNLTVSHHATGRNPADDGVNALAILWVLLFDSSSLFSVHRD
jgi:hypothetical protein